jgi:hypothetical protein
VKYQNIREEELKNKIAQDYFWNYDCSKIMGNLDFCACIPKSETLLSEQDSLLWAEAKKGSADLYKSITQLILTIGKARTFDKYLPPALLGAFDGEKIAFIPYNEIHDVFYINDFNWNVTPSNHDTKEFQQILDKVKIIIQKQTLLFFYDRDDYELNKFIKSNFVIGKFGLTKTKIDKNNFMVIYNKWLQSVKATIDVNWDIAKKSGIIDGDFYLADLLSQENETLKEKLFVLLKNDHYILDRKITDIGLFNETKTGFNDGQKAHVLFWNKYERPPKKEYWDYIADRRDLLVPQDVRERKGSFFTPRIWVDKSQEYLADVLGEDWQDEYYIWDCAAGTGNLLANLVNKYNIYASTLDKQDVDVMHDRIDTMNSESIHGDGANLLHDHVFQFDFLNDDFTKLPKSLQDIINNPQKRKKLIIYINPPYAEASDKKTLGKIEGKKGVEQSKTNLKYAQKLGQGNAELFVQFLTRIYFEIPECIIAEFSKLKIISGPHFIDFRNFFKAKFKKGFVCPANSFDNVKGEFPIGFMIWDTDNNTSFKKIKLNVFDKIGNKLDPKVFHAYDNNQYINDWIKPFRADISKNQLIGKFPFKGNDFQNQNMIQIVHHKMDYNTEAGQFLINQKNVMHACIYFAVRKCIKASWLNDRDQFLFPNNKWEKDIEFQNDCIAYTLFTNNIQSQFGANHWIPFSEKEIKAREKFESNFMSQYIAGKIDTEVSFDLFNKVEKKEQKPIQFSTVAQEVLDAGKSLWSYYHKQAGCIVNASLYDIREYFQGRNETGKMKTKSTDETYTELIDQLREKIKDLAKKIEPKIFEFGFLMN